MIQAINAFWAHEKLPDHWKNFPEQPAVWTEHWTAWYDTWGTDHRTRGACETAAAAARFFASGGTGMNYYMWFGGTNFAREAMYLQATSHDYDAPLDEHGIATTKANHLARLHKILHKYAPLLLQDRRPEPIKVGENQVLLTYANATYELQFVCNDDKLETAVVSHEGKNYTLPQRGVLIFSDGKPIFTAGIPRLSA